MKRTWHNSLNPFSIIVCPYIFFSFEDQLQHACTFIFDSYYAKRLHRWKMNDTNMYINISSIYISYIFKIWNYSFAKLLCNWKQNVTWNTEVLNLHEINVSLFLALLTKNCFIPYATFLHMLSAHQWGWMLAERIVFIVTFLGKKSMS